MCSMTSREHRRRRRDEGGVRVAQALLELGLEREPHPTRRERNGVSEPYGIGSVVRVDQRGFVVAMPRRAVGCANSVSLETERLQRDRIYAPPHALQASMRAVKPAQPERASTLPRTLAARCGMNSAVGEARSMKHDPARLPPAGSW
jgi:hypothetical protein